jgi:hypothetical protein
MRLRSFSRLLRGQAVMYRTIFFSTFSHFPTHILSRPRCDWKKLNEYNHPFGMRNSSVLYRLLMPALLLFLVSHSSCILPTEYTDSNEYIYISSFESPQDTLGWTGYGSMRLSGDTPPGGAKTSISGGGGVGLATDFQDADVYRGIGFSVRDSEWTFYRSEEVLFVEKDKRLTIHIGAGGIAPGTILVDLLAIRKVDE